MTIPITIIAGYLGAGKTTLINRLLGTAEQLQGTAVLVNDFGEVNIDAELIARQSPDGRVIALTNGCVCCSIKNDLATTLETLTNLEIDHILLEASGVGVPEKLRTQCLYPGYHARGCVVLLDAQQHAVQRQDKYVGTLVRQQTKEADLLLLSKTDLGKTWSLDMPYMEVQDPALPALLLNPDAPLSIRPPEDGLGSRTTAEDLPAVFISMTLKQHEPVSESRLRALLSNLPVSLARAKGFIRTDTGTVLLQLVGQDYELVEQPPVTDHQLVFIYPQSAKTTEEVLSALQAWHEWDLSI